VAIIEVNNVSKKFRARRGGRLLIGRGGFSDWIRMRRPGIFTALQDISLSVEAGESLGIIGANGSGKSTLLKIIAGVTVPTTGEVKVWGRVASLLELGAGFHPMLTGRENVYLNAGIMGMRHAEVDRVIDDIVEFSGVGAFIDSPVDTYSSGMFVRVAFAVAVHVNPDVFLVDEVLAVGDEEFQRRCRTKLSELRTQGKTLVFVSHDLGIVNTLCDRVVLLHEGQMLSRPTPQQTIDFYLRTVGREEGICTLSEGDTEVIFNNGHLNIFHKQHEVTAASGTQADLVHLNSLHLGPSAEWRVLERSSSRLTASGRMPRLPMHLIYELELKDGKLVWRMALQVDQPTEIDVFSANLCLPVQYGSWVYGDLSGDFPEIMPDDLHWNLVVMRDPDVLETAALPDLTGDQNSPLPPVVITMTPHASHMTMEWYNNDYISGSRVMQAAMRLPKGTPAFSHGRADILTLTLDMNMPIESVRNWAREREARRVLRSGGTKTRFRRGRLYIEHDDEMLTHCLHGYGSIMIGNLWTDSQNMRWESVERRGSSLLAKASSRRFPFGEEWQLTETENGLQVKIWLIVQETLEVQEYHFCLVLRKEYSSWATDNETGTFPDQSGLDDWKHLNRIYSPGRYIHAYSDVLPTVKLELEDEAPSLRMTAINTEAGQEGRVIQALRTPERGLLTFEAGRHLYFSGAIRVGNADDGEGSGE
jgi:ABC-type polysaccharide/polyol phosphate transport system ATPase subunit